MATENYTLGRYMITFQPDGETGELDLGNCPEFNLTINVETLAHYSSREGLKKKDAEIVTEQTATASFTLDEPNIENLKLFIMSGIDDSNTQTAGSDSSPMELQVDKLDRWYDLGKIGLTSVEVKDSTDNTTYQEGTDYEVHLDSGRIFIKSSGNISEGETLHVTRTWGALVSRKIAAASTTTVKGHLKAIANPAAGRKIDIIGYGSLKPSGDLGIISDEWMRFSLQFEYLKHDAYSGLFEVRDRGYVTAD